MPSTTLTQKQLAVGLRELIDGVRDAVTVDQWRAAELALRVALRDVIPSKVIETPFVRNQVGPVRLAWLDRYLGGQS